MPPLRLPKGKTRPWHHVATRKPSWRQGYARQRCHSKMAAVPRWPSATILDIIDIIAHTLSNGAIFDDLQWPRTPVSRSRYSLKANISQTVHPIHSISASIGKGFRGRRIEWRYFRFDNIQDGSWWPSWNDGAVARNLCVSLAFLF